VNSDVGGFVTKHDFEPVVLEEPKDRRLRPLFVGRIADALDSVADIGSLLFSAALVFGGIGLMAYNLYSVVVALSSRGAWLALSSIALLVLVVAFYFWLSSVTKRLVIISVLAVLSFAASPILERVLT
jgi:hypothetical protein